VLEWLNERIPGGATAEDCRADNNAALRLAAHYGHVGVLEWLATKLTSAEFARFGCENVWRQVQQQVRRKSMLALVVAGKRKKLRLPPELWELVEQWY
jgi:N6-adenosine-specific RNA methylase IME4